MKLTARLTKAFLDIKVDEIETTIFKDSINEIQELRENLNEILEYLNELQNK